MIKDRYFSMNLQPELDCIIDVLNPVSVQPVFIQAVGLAFNALEVCANADATVWFISYTATFFNNEGATRGITFQTVANLNVYYQAVSSTAVGIAGNDRYLLFNRFRISSAGGFVANAATVVTFTGLRIKT